MLSKLTFNFPSGDIILGDSFLRSAYVVYDLVNNPAAMAQTKFNTTDSEVVPFASFGATVPHATLAPDKGAGTGADYAVTVTATVAYSAATGFAASYYASAGAEASSSAAPSSADASTSSDDASSSSSGKEYVKPLAIGGAAAGVLVLASGANIWRTMAVKKARKQYAKAVQGEEDAQGPVDEAKVPLVLEETEYGRLSQVQTAYGYEGAHHN